MITSIFAKIFGTRNDRELKTLQPLVNKINDLEPSMKALSDSDLTAKTAQFKEQVEKGRTLDDILPEAYAVVRETGYRKLGQRHFDVQLMGGIVLHQGKISEMKTGEGKTLTATLPLYLNALSGKSTQLVTVNDYLARRDAEWMAPLFSHLGLSIGVIQHSLSDSERKSIYCSDIVYATNNELGFDYLRDNMKFRLLDYVQRDLTYAIVDEVDSILIDEARTPLIISGASEESSRLYADANQAVKQLIKDDYEVDEKQRSVQLNEAGNDKIESFFGIQNLYDLTNLKMLHHVNQALKANTLFKKDFEYVVRDEEVLIVDEFTGRILPGRRYSDGLHQAIEAKEGVKIERESQTLASITLQNYFRLYSKLAGMTGTAATESEEFHKIYKLDVVSIPTNQPMIRIDQPDLIFLNKQSKYTAIVEDVRERHKKGQPILIGTVAVETSELLSKILQASGVPHEVLNAKNHAREAEIVAHAGEYGRVTIATNMAGRGTDIKLNPESLNAGGLYILGTERHESRRIDNQLRGRSGRQGDPGESRFYLSLDDDLIKIFGGDTFKAYMEKIGFETGESIESPRVSKSIEGAQEKVEKHNFDQRKHLIEYDDVLNQQRTVVYNLRRLALESTEKISQLVGDMIFHVVKNVIVKTTAHKVPTDDEVAIMIKVFSAMTNQPAEGFEKLDLYSNKNIESLSVKVSEFLLTEYRLRVIEANQADEKMATMIKDANKWLMLENIDQAWKQHMLNLDNLKEGIGLRGWGQKNPLIEYKREAFAMFEDMMNQIRTEIIAGAFHLNIEHFNKHDIERRREQELSQASLVGPSDAADDTIQMTKVGDKTKRNEDCPCGSGKKYKKCCLIQSDTKESKDTN